MTVFGYNYFTDHYGSGNEIPTLLSYTGIHGLGGEYACEAINLVNGTATVQEPIVSRIWPCPDGAGR